MISVNRGPAPTDNLSLTGARRVPTVDQLLREEADAAAEAYGLPADAFLELLHRPAAPRSPPCTWQPEARDLGQPGRVYVLLLTTPFRSRQRSAVDLSTAPLCSVLYRNAARPPRTGRWHLRAVAGPFASARLARDLRDRLAALDGFDEQLDAMRAEPGAVVP